MGSRLHIEFDHLGQTYPKVDFRIEGQLGKQFVYHVEAFRAALMAICPELETREDPVEDTVTSIGDAASRVVSRIRK